MLIRKEASKEVYMRSGKLNEGTNYKVHSDLAIDEVKRDIDKLLDLHRELKPSHFNDPLIRDSIIRIQNLLSYLYNAYRIESKVDTENSDIINKKLFREADDEMLRARLEAEKLVNLLGSFDHKFSINP